MFSKFLRLFLPFTFMGFITLVLPSIYANEQAQELSRTEQLQKLLSSLPRENNGDFADMPFEIIQQDILKWFDVDNDKATLGSLMCVNRAFLVFVDGFYSSVNHPFASWQSCPYMHQRVLYYTFKYIGEIVGMYINIRLNQSFNDDYGIDYRRFERHCSSSYKSKLWSDDIIPELYPQYLLSRVIDGISDDVFQDHPRMARLMDPFSEYLEAQIITYGEEGELTKGIDPNALQSAMESKNKHAQFNFFIGPVLSIFYRQCKNDQVLIPSEWILVLQRAYLFNGEIFLKSTQKAMDESELTVTRSRLFAPFNLQLMTLKAAVATMSPDDPRYCDTLSTIVRLEPIPTVKQMDMACRAWCRNGNYANAAVYLDMIIQEVIQHIDYLRIKHYGDARLYVFLTADAYQAYHELAQYLSHKLIDEDTQSVDDYMRVIHAYIAAGRLGEAANYCRELKSVQSSLSKKLTTNDFTFMARVFSMAGEMSLKRKQYDEAGDFHTEAIWALGTAGQLPDSMLYERSSYAYESAEQYEDAIKYYLPILERHKAAKREVPSSDYKHMAKLYGKAGDACVKDGQLRKAKMFHSKEIEAWQAAGKPVKKCYGRLCKVYDEAELYAEAYHYFSKKRKALEEAKQEIPGNDQLYMFELSLKCFLYEIDDIQNIDSNDGLKEADDSSNLDAFLLLIKFYKGIIDEARKLPGFVLDQKRSALLCGALVKAGDVCFNTEKLDDALDFYLMAIDEHKAAGQALEHKIHKRVGDAYLKANSRKACDYYQIYIKQLLAESKKVEPEDYKCHGLALFQAERYIDAVGAYDKEKDARRAMGVPIDADFLKRMGDACFGAKNYEKAKTQYDLRIKLLEKDGLHIEDAYLDAQKACEHSSNAMVKGQAEKYKKMAIQTRAKDRS